MIGLRLLKTAVGISTTLLAQPLINVGISFFVLLLSVAWTCSLEVTLMKRLAKNCNVKRGCIVSLFEWLFHGTSAQ